MSKINIGRWLAGGLVAGLIVNISETVLNVVVLKKSWEDVMKSLGRPSVLTPSALAVMVAWGFAYGLVCVWIYAGIRPRFGPGPGTAARAGLVAWLLTDLLTSVGMGTMGIFPANVLAISCVWSLVESLVATTVGAWIYKEA